MQREAPPKTPEPELYEEGLFSSPYVTIAILLLVFLLAIIVLL